MIITAVLAPGGTWCWYNFNPTPDPAWYPAGDLGSQFHAQGCVTAPGRPPEPWSYYRARGIRVISGPPPAHRAPGPRTPHRVHPVRPGTGTTWCYYTGVGITGGINEWAPRGTITGATPWNGTCYTGIGRPSWTPVGAPPLSRTSGGAGGLAGAGILAVFVVAAIVLRFIARRRAG